MHYLLLIFIVTDFYQRHSCFKYYCVASSACRTQASAIELTRERANTRAISLDVKDAPALLEAVKRHDVVIR